MIEEVRVVTEQAIVSKELTIKKSLVTHQEGKRKPSRS